MVPASKRARFEEYLLSVPGKKLRLIFPNSHHFPSTQGPAAGVPPPSQGPCAVWVMRTGLDSLEFQVRSQEVEESGQWGRKVRELREERKGRQRRGLLSRKEEGKRKKEEMEGE